MQNFNNSWLGYDLPYDEIENLPSVQTLRRSGVEKRVKSPEHHVTVAYFETINLEDLKQALIRAEQEYGGSLNLNNFYFDGYGVLEQKDGKYVYFSPGDEGSKQAKFLKDFLVQTSLYNPQKNCHDLHLSIGGPDPFCPDKPKTNNLSQPFNIQGSLIFVGHDGKKFRKYRWDSEQQNFVAIDNPANQLKDSDSKPFFWPDNQAPKTVNILALFPKIQADTAVAHYILMNYGEAKFPGIKQAKVVFWTALPQGQTAEQLESQGHLTIDLGGMFDHHLANEELGKKQECVSGLIARYLGVEANPELKKLLAWAKRDDLEGKGTLSADPLDRAFGLSGIIMNANREYTDDPMKTLNLATAIIDLHVKEEYRRQVELPKLLEELEKSGRAQSFSVKQGSADLLAYWAETDSTALPGFLRAAKKADLVIQRRSTNHTNIITQQLRSLDLRPLIAVLRLSEADKKGVALPVDEDALTSPGRIQDIEEWYYDDAANSIQNGGISPEGVPATRLTKNEIISLVKETLPLGIIGSLKRQKQADLSN